MNRTNFQDAYREARITLQVMADDHDRSGKSVTRDRRRNAEECWIVAIKGSKRDAYMALAYRLRGTPVLTSSGALYAFKHGFYNRTDIWDWKASVKAALRKHTGDKS